MFRSMMRDFEEDPFFSSHREHIRRMDQMMGGFMSPFDNLFGDMGFPRLMAPENEHYSNNQRQAAGGGALMPFGFGRPFFPNMRDMFSDFEHVANDPNCHSYSSSSVFTYTTGEDGAPKIYQASSSTRSAPGGVKETRRTECDSESGVKKMAIGHHLGERAHIVEKAQYGNTSQQEETQEFINMDEDDAERFNHEWVRTTRQQPRYEALESSENRLRRQYINDEQKALPSPSSRKRENKDPSGKSEKSRRKMLEKLKAKKQPKNDN